MKNGAADNRLVGRLTWITVISHPVFVFARRADIQSSDAITLMPGIDRREPSECRGQRAKTTHPIQAIRKRYAVQNRAVGSDRPNPQKSRAVFGAIKDPLNIRYAVTEQARNIVASRKM